MQFTHGDFEQMFTKLVEQLMSGAGSSTTSDYKTVETVLKGLRMRIVLSDMQVTLNLYVPSTYDMVFRVQYNKEDQSWLGDIRNGRTYVNQLLILEQMGLIS